jgi:hypothetical protein
MIDKKKELPKSFACRNTNQELWNKYIKWLDAGFNGNVNIYYGIHKEGFKTSGNYHGNIKKSYDTILSLEEWDEIVNGKQIKEEVMKTIEITRSQLEEIHNVACTSWKDTIVKFANRSAFKDTIELTDNEVNAMFAASNNIQIPVLENIFGKQTKELDFQSDNINFEVDGISVFGISNMKSDESFIGLPRANHPNSFFLNTDYNWTLADGVLTVTRKNN